MLPVVFNDRRALRGLTKEMREAEGQPPVCRELGRVDSRAEQPDLGHAFGSGTRTKLFEGMFRG